jgi:large repetitive protein
MSWLVCVALIVCLLPFGVGQNQATEAAAGGSWKERFKNDVDILEITRAGATIGSFTDRSGISHKLLYYSTVKRAGSNMKGGFQFRVESASETKSDWVLKIETYMKTNGVLKLIDVSTVNKAESLKTLVFTDAYISDIQATSYVYFRATLSEGEKSDIGSNEILFKVKSSSLSYISNSIEGSYVLYTNESTDADNAQSSGDITGVRSYHANSDAIPLETYQIDANIPLDPKESPLAFQKKNTKYMSPLKLGNTQDFWVSDFTNDENVQINAKLAYVGEKVNVWVHDQQITEANAAQLGKEFDAKIYPAVTNAFGKESDVDGDGKINILCFDIKDGYREGEDGGYVGGYFNQNDLHMTATSNGAEVLYIDTNPALGKNKDELEKAFSTIAHELQHLINHNQNVIIEGKKPMDVWLDEALAMAAEQIYTGKMLANRIQYYNLSYSIATGHSLLYWDYDGDVLSNYALSYLFGQYVKNQARRGDAIFKEILSQPNNDYLAVEAVIQKYIDPNLTFGKFMTHFRTALVMKKPTGLDGFYGDPVASDLQPRTYAKSRTDIRGGGALLVKVNPTVGFFAPSDDPFWTNGKDISYKILSTNHIPAEQIPIQRFEIDPIKEVDEQVSGIAYLNGTVTISIDGKKVATATVGGDGKFLLKIPKQPVGTKIEITSTHPNGYYTQVTKYVLDGIAPEKPIVHEVKHKDTRVGGEAEANSEITVRVNGGMLATGQTNSFGTFLVTIPPQPVGTVLYVSSKDSAGNQSDEVAVTVGQSPPAVETVSNLTDKDRVVSGVADATSTVYVKKGSTVIGKGKTDRKGAFSIKIPAQNAGTELAIYAEASNGLAGEEVVVIVTKVPSKPSGISAGDHSLFVKGKADPNVTVIVEANGEWLGETVSDNKGVFSVKLDSKLRAGSVLTVYAVNADDNKSEVVKVTVKDLTAPAAPTSLVVTKTTITGKAEIGATVYISNGKKTLAKATVNKNGHFQAKIPTQKKGSSLTVYAVDKAGNKSKTVKMVVK